MIQFNNLPKNIDVQRYNATDGVTWETWDKPFGCTTAYIVCIGGGGGAGAGSYSSGSTSAGYGGGNGAASAFTIAQVPFYFIPDTMYVRVGLGGIPGTPNSTSGGQGVNGGSGGFSYVSFYPSTSMADCLVTNSLSAAPGGISPSAGSTGGPPAGPSALVNSASGNPLYLSLCNWTSYPGNGGSFPVTNNTAPTNSTICGTTILAAGAGGGGNSSSAPTTGGSVVSSDSLVSFFTNIPANAVNGIANNGYGSIKPFFFTGGPGGTSGRGAVSGAGGNGAPGCGGGGSGAGAGATPSNGGYGGNGLVIIISF